MEVAGGESRRVRLRIRARVTVSVNHSSEGTPHGCKANRADAKARPANAAGLLLRRMVALDRNRAIVHLIFLHVVQWLGRMLDRRAMVVQVHP